MAKKVNRNKTEDLKKLADAFYKNLKINTWEFGGIGIDPKRPFGNSDVPADMLEIIGWDPTGCDDGYMYPAEYQIDYVTDLYRKDLIPFLQKNWVTYMLKAGTAAETQVKRIHKENQIRMTRSTGYLQDIFEALDKPAKELIPLLYELQRSWKDDE